MSYPAYRIGSGTMRQRVLGTAAGVLVPLVVLIALDYGLKLNLISMPGDVDIVVVDPPPEREPVDPEIVPPIDPTVPSEVFIERPEIVFDGDPNDTITPTTAVPDTQAGFLSRNLLPTYPESAMANCQQGVVTVTLRIGADGRVTEARLANSSGYSALDDAALRTARAWKFSPALLGGKAVESEVTKNVRFDLRNEIGKSMTEREVRECLGG